MILSPPTSGQWELVRQWRLTCPEALRTPFPLTVEEQEQHYHDIVANRAAKAHTRWWMYGADCAVGLEGISPTNRRAEVSLIVNPAKQGQGIGAKALKAVLNEAWGVLNLHSVWGETYFCSGAIGFWQDQVKQYGGTGAIIPHTKWWGRWYDSWLFTILSPLETTKLQGFPQGFDADS